METFIKKTMSIMTSHVPLVQEQIWKAPGREQKNFNLRQYFEYKMNGTFKSLVFKIGVCNLYC